METYIVINGIRWRLVDYIANREAAIRLADPATAARARAELAQVLGAQEQAA